MQAKGPRDAGLGSLPTFLRTVLLLLAAFPNYSRAQGNTVYIYDQLGRLVGVVDPSSQTARYFYDATGNILSVSRYSSAQLSIIEFTPNAGPAATTVEIYGTGFSATATLDKVAFNGVPATIISASTTEIVTTVPAGAKTGLIMVTSPAGSVTSTQPFNIGLPNTPTVHSFTPTIGSPGTAVTITGTNFQTVAGNNTVRFNVAPSKIGPTTALTIKTNVPIAATSGRISVTTPNGTGTSTADFFAPPAPFTANEVAFTGRMSTGKSSTMTVNTAGDIGLMLFDEAQGHRVSLVASNVTFAECGTLSILSPSGLTLASNNSICSGSSAFLDTSSPSTGGTYTILGQTTASGAGGATLTLYDIPQDFMASIVPGGPAVTVKLSIPGQNAVLTFAGTGGEKVSLELTNGTFPACSPNVSILNPDGTVLFSDTCFGGGGFVSAQTLPATGTYRILLTAIDPGTGQLTARLYQVVNLTGTIVINGSAFNLNFITPGQVAALTFAGTANKKTTLHVTNNALLNGCLTVAVTEPNGTMLTSTLDCGNFTVQPPALPVTGTYTISIVPYQGDTGRLAVAITSP